MKTLLAILFSMSLLTSCYTGVDNVHSTVSYPTSVSKTLLNVGYGKDSLQIMDIYLPAGRSEQTTPAIILIHGGGWNGGSKSDLNNYIDSFKRRMPEYAIFNLDYRLVNNGHIFPSQENDIKSAIEQITKNASQYGINKTQLALVGASAGAHLAMLHAYKYGEPYIKAVVNFFGPTDLVHMYQKPWHPFVPFALQMVTGTSPEVNETIYRQSSPLHFVSAASAPTLIFHGARDQVVDISQSKLLKKKLEESGVSHELVIYPNEKHGWHGKSLHNSFDKIEAFLAEHLN